MTKRREMESGDNKQRIEYAEICKSIKKKAREDIRKYTQEIIRETIIKESKESPKNAKARLRPTDDTPGQAG